MLAAEKGDAFAQLQLSNLLEQMAETAPNERLKKEQLNKVEYWLTQAANQNGAVAQRELALFYRLWRPEKQDEKSDALFEKMIKYLILAARQGDPIALYNLGATYEELISHDTTKWTTKRPEYDCKAAEKILRPPKSVCMKWFTAPSVAYKQKSDAGAVY